MAGISAQQLNIILTARDREFARAMERNQRRIEKFSRSSKKNLSNTTKSFDAMGTAAKRIVPILAATFSVGAITNAINNVTKMALELDNLSTLAGTNVEDFQAMAFAADKYGVGQEKLADILKDVNDKVGDFMATGGGPLKDFFDNIAPKVGLTAEAFAKLSGPDALQAYVSALEEAGVNQSELTFYMEALANDATILTPLLADNGAEMGRLTDKARDLGIVLDQDLIARSADLQRRWSEVMGRMRSIFNAFVMDVVIGLDDIFGITDRGQFNQLGEQLSDQYDELKILEKRLGDVRGQDPSMGFGGSQDALVTDLRTRVADQHALINITEAQMDELDRLATERREIQDRLENPTAGVGGGGAGGGGGSAKTINDLEKITKEYETLLHSLDPVAAAADRYAVAQQKINAAVGAGVISQTEANAALELAKAKFQEASGAASGLSDVMGTVESSMTDAFMAMADGTQTATEAFRSMARDIIKELYRVLVVQQIVGNFETGGGGILGTLAPAFGRASGGPVQAGTPYTVGEHGRELFVPHSAGRIMTAPQVQQGMGGGGTVNLYQTNNFAKDMATIARAEIHSAIPYLTQASKAAVLDAQRRGGGFASEF